MPAQVNGERPAARRARARGRAPAPGERPRVVAVVLNWNRAPLTLACLASLDALTYPNVELLVVDNGSSDGSQERIERERPGCRVLQTGANLGYAGGNNAGIRAALERGAEFVWVLNNDTTVEPDSLGALVEVAERVPTAGIVGSAVLNSLSESAAAGIAAAAYHREGIRLAGFSCPADDSCPADGHRVDGVAGTSILLRAEMLSAIGGFEERFFHYWDDVEICDRAVRAGWEIRYACRARVWHEVSATIPYQSPQARYYYIRNWLLYSRWSREEGLGSLLRADPVLAVGRVTGAKFLARGDWRMARESLVGTADALRGRTGFRDRVADGLPRRALVRMIGWARRDPLYAVDPEAPLAGMAEVTLRRGVDAARGLLAAARMGRAGAPLFVGRGVKLVAASQIRVGRGCVLGDHVMIDALSRRGVVLGDNVTLDRFVILKCTGAIREIGEGIRIGDSSSIGAFSYVGGSGGLVIGSGVLGGQRLSFHPENHVFDDPDVPIREQGSTRRGIVIEDDCWLGSGAVFLDGVTVGRGSVVAAGSVVSSDVPPYSVVGGVPARVLRDRRAGEPPPG